MAKASIPADNAEMEEHAPVLTVGRRVHYGVLAIAQGADSNDVVVPNYADVLELDEFNLPTLRIHHPNGSIDVQKHVPFSEELAEGCWSWPPRPRSTPPARRHEGPW